MLGRKCHIHIRKCCQRSYQAWRSPPRLDAHLCIFEGDLTCCRLRHERGGELFMCDRGSLVSIVLAFYAVPRARRGEA